MDDFNRVGGFARDGSYVLRRRNKVVGGFGFGLVAHRGPVGESWCGERRGNGNSGLSKISRSWAIRVCTAWRITHATDTSLRRARSRNAAYSPLSKLTEIRDSFLFPLGRAILRCLLHHFTPVQQKQRIPVKGPPVQRYCRILASRCGVASSISVRSTLPARRRCHDGISHPKHASGKLPSDQWSPLAIQMS